ncbi:MAG: hypothetical protein Fur0024_2280 [Patescibacteria group bacterium]
MKILKKSFFFFSLFSFIFALSSCQLKSKKSNSNEEKTTKTNNSNEVQEGKTEEKVPTISLENSVVTNTLFFDKNGKESKTTAIPVLKNLKTEIEKLVTDIDTKNLVLNFKYNPFHSKIFILVGDSSQFNIFQPYQKIFISDLDGTNLKMVYTLSQTDQNSANYLAGFTFSADGKTEAGWIEQDRSIEEYPTRIKIVNLEELIKDTKSVSFNQFELPPDFAFFNNFLAIQTDILIFKSDKIVGEKYGDSLLNYSSRSSNSLRVKPFLFIEDAIKFLNISNSEVSIGTLFSSNKKTGKENIIYSIIATSQTGSTMFLVEQSEVAKIKVVKSFKDTNFSCESQVAIREKIPCVQLSFDSKIKTGSLVQFDLSTGKILEITKSKNLSELGNNPIWWEIN